MCKYLLANGQPNDRAIYFTNEESYQGGMIWGNVEDAYQFDNLDELFDKIKCDGCTASPIIVEVYDETWRRIQEAAKDKNSEYRNLYFNFNTVSYITNSRKEQ